MASRAIVSVAAFLALALALAPHVHARGRGHGSGGGGSSGGSGSGSGDTVNMEELVHVGPWLIAKKWLILGGIVIGVIVLAIVAFVLIKCGVFKKLNNRKTATTAAQKVYQQHGAHVMQTTKGDTHPGPTDTGTWGTTWRMRAGPQQHYVQIQPVHSHTPLSTWSADSQHKLPYAQGGLGYTPQAQSDPSAVVYHPPPTPPVPYNQPYH